MAQLILVRHSHVNPNASIPSSDWRLSDEGRERCGPLAELLEPYKLHSLVSSDHRRAVETAALLAERLGVTSRVAADLDEHRRPYLPSQTEFEAAMQRFFASPAQRVFGVESADELAERFKAAAEAAIEAEGSEKAAIVSHGTAIAVYAAPFFGVGAAALWERLDAPAFLVIDTTAGRGERIVDSVVD